MSIGRYLSLPDIEAQLAPNNYTYRERRHCTGGDNLYGCLNSLNSGKYAYNNLQSPYLTWYHEINSKWQNGRS